MLNLKELYFNILMNKLSIDFGGTTYSFLIFENDNILLKSPSFDLKKFNNYQDLLFEISNKVSKIVDKIDFIGVACPGPLDSKSGIVLNTPNLTIFQNLNLKEEIKKYFKCSNVNIENDANVYALGSYYLLKNKQDNDVLLGITLGTGIGFGIIINGKLFQGSYGMSGEYELSPLENNKTWANLIGYRFFENQEGLTPKQIFDKAEKNDEVSKNIWKEYGKNIGMCLSHVIGVINPNHISIGGGVSKAKKYFHKSMVEYLEKYCLIFDKQKINFFYDEENLHMYYGGLCLNKKYILI